MDKVFYDIMPDNTVSVYVCGDWDLFRSYGSLVHWCDSELDEYELVDITDTTYAERMEIMVDYI